MSGFIWINGAIFSLGFFHGLRGDHLLEILNSENAPNIYEHPAWISFKLGLAHLGYLLCLIVPLVLFKIIFPPLLLFPFHIVLSIFFLILGLYSFYEFFWLPPKLLHQHGHPHKHEHGHVHKAPSSLKISSRDDDIPFYYQKDKKNCKAKKLNTEPGTGHVDHLHSFPQDIDEPGSFVSDHTHLHYHQHEHLHFHDPKAKQKHFHYHYSRFYKLLKSPRNLLLLLTISLTSLVFPLTGIFIFFATFFIGLYSAVYLLEIVYRGRGINLMAKITHLSSFFLGLIGVGGFWLFW